MEGNQRKKFRLINVRTAVLIGLIVLPIIVYAVVGCIAVWQIGWLGWLWWVIPLFWIATWIVARFWPAGESAESRPLQSPFWTPRDEAATEIVQRYQKQIDRLKPEQLTDLHFYLSQAQSMAADISRHYRPNAEDPVTSLTVPEVIAAIRLVADDLEQLVLHSIPGSRMLTIGQWRSLAQAPKWIRWATNSVWAAAILLNPVNIARYGSSRLTSDRVAERVQTELLATVYLRFTRQVGFYLIEMNSGRLRGGADVYRRTFDKRSNEGSQIPSGAKADSDSGAGDGRSKDADTENDSLEIALVGQTSAGKSSLINAMLGSSAAPVDILPETDSIQRYRLLLGVLDASRKPSGPRTITLLDTPGYSQAGAEARQIVEIQSALTSADAVLLVMAANAPARQADQQILESIEKHYHANPRLKPPPVIAVLTHVDLLSPVMVWSPPYDWQTGSLPKEQSIAGAIEYARQIQGAMLVDVIPVCTHQNPDRRWGIVEFLIPALIGCLDQAQSVSLLSAFENALDRHRLKNLIRQTAASGKQMVLTWLRERFDN